MIFLILIVLGGLWCIGSHIERAEDREMDRELNQNYEPYWGDEEGF